MRRSGLLFLEVCLLALWVSVSGTNLPCAARQESAGYVCVCNSVYCDTIQRPKKLKSGQFHHYFTSATQPGFNLQSGFFSTDTELDDTNVKFQVNASLRYQTFQGIGAGISDTAAINFNNLSPKAQKHFIQSFFGVKGLEYVFGRIPLGASDCSPRFYTMDDVPGDVNLTYFQLPDEDLKLKIPMIKKANRASKRGGLKLLATPWTPPAWMKTDNKSTVGFLKKEYESTYAQYLLRYFQEYKKQGLSFWGLSQGNEMMLGFKFGFPMPNLISLPPQLKSWTRDYLGPVIKNSEFSYLKIITLDDERPFMEWYTRELLEDDATSPYIDGVGLHWYFDSSDNTYVLDDFYAKYSDKFLIYTESSIMDRRPHLNDLVPLGSWSDAEQYIESVIQNFNHFVTGFMDWNICLDEEGGPPSSILQASVIVNSTTGEEFYKQPFFYALGHFSKFIPPGAQRINVTSGRNSSFPITEEHLVDSAEASVELNEPTPGPRPTGQPGPGPEPTKAPFTELVSVASVNPDGSHTFIVYNPRSEAVGITISDTEKGTITKTVEPQSLNTFIYW